MKFSLPLPFCSIQALSKLADDYSYWGGQSALVLKKSFWQFLIVYHCFIGGTYPWKSSSFFLYWYNSIWNILISKILEGHCKLNIFRCNHLFNCFRLQPLFEKITGTPFKPLGVVHWITKNFNLITSFVILFYALPLFISKIYSYIFF